jgi:hypothetical protein
VAPVFYPFAHQGTGGFDLHGGALRRHYRRIFASPLCLGIFSHIPETLRGLSTFFDDPEIDGKLFPSRIGLSEHTFAGVDLLPKKPLTHARFLFLNSAHQNRGGFFKRGGHVVLRFWKEFRALGHSGSLHLRCSRPTDKDLRGHEVDVDFLRAEENRSIFWIEDYLTMPELNALVAESHFFLLPSWSLHSASIMQALAMGTVPVVTDTLGTSHYVTDDQNGIMLKGVFAANWETDPATGILIDRYRTNPALDQQLVSQMTQRISAFMTAPHRYEQLCSSALECSRRKFSGSLFSEDFWARVARLSNAQPACPSQDGNRAELTTQLSGCLVEDRQWQSIFESTTQPVHRFFTGNARVSELGGVFVADDNSAGQPHDWSVMAKHFLPFLSSMHFAHSIKELESGCLLGFRHSFGNQLSRLLQSMPAVQTLSRKVFSAAKRARNRLLRMKADKF